MDKTNQIELENKPDIGFHQMELDDRILKVRNKKNKFNFKLKELSVCMESTVLTTMQQKKKRNYISNHLYTLFIL